VANGTFDLLAPNVVISATEETTGLEMDGTLTTYPSYVNRVYGLRSVDGAEYISKFYRPGRWDAEAIADEHEFVMDCARGDVPVVEPISAESGSTLGSVISTGETGEQEYFFAVYPKRGGRSFDAEADSDWLRLGTVVGRVHAAGAGRQAAYRLVCTPAGSTGGFLQELRDESVVHPEVAPEFFKLAFDAVHWLSPLFDGLQMQRIHGDFHRGNILDRPGEGLLIVDFDDMMMGPAIQDLWLLLPDRAHQCRRELGLLVEGYREFHDFDEETVRLVEPLRLMRMLYYIAWSSRQRDDNRFRSEFPGWGSKAFWEQELEDLTTQLAVIRDDLEEEAP
jgi:Ser/Thr protein kinase RdoA (MazF antagonist)